MRPEAVSVSPASLSGARWPAAWGPAVLRLGGAAGLLVLAFLGAWSAMASQWWNISTYSHVLLVPAILAWLVALRREALVRLTPVATWPGLALFALAVALWLAGALAGLAVIEQAGAVAMLGALVPALLGFRVSRALLFPLAYMVFLVPFGDELVPLLQVLDAKLSVALLHLTATPARLDGVFITTPAGLFEIAEACSGVKFLVAMIAFGVLAAHVCFRSAKRRAAFMAACIVVPVLANGVRSWATIYVAQYVGAAKAGGFDHIVYGWIFFALVIAGTMAGAWRFFDRPGDAPLADASAILASRPLARLDGAVLPPLAAVIAMAALVVGAQGWVSAADRLAAPLPPRIDLPQVPGWTLADSRPATAWEPRASGAEGRLLGRYADGRGHVVDVFVAVYAAQGPGCKADGWGEGAWRPGSAWSWQGPGSAPADARGDRLLAGGPTERLAQTSYVHGGLVTGSGARLRLAVIADRLLLRARPTTMLVLSTGSGPGFGATPGPDSLAAFRAAMGPVAPFVARLGAEKGN